MSSDLYLDDDEAVKQLGFRFIRDLDAEPDPLRRALLDALADMAVDDRQLRKTG